MDQGLVNFVPTVAHPFCHNVSEKFSQPGDQISTQLCMYLLQNEGLHFIFLLPFSFFFMASAMGPDRAVALRRLYHDMFLGPILEEMSTLGGTSKTTTSASTLSPSAKTTMKTTSETTTTTESIREWALAKCVVNGVAYQDLETVGDRQSVTDMRTC